jgi:hypothetical protein
MKELEERFPQVLFVDVIAFQNDVKARKHGPEKTSFTERAEAPASTHTDQGLERGIRAIVDQVRDRGWERRRFGICAPIYKLLT